jgi:lipid-binding SYLF domain-containing protein
MKRVLPAVLIGFLVVPLCYAFPFWEKKTPDQQRREMRADAAKALKRLYKLAPGSKGVIRQAAGYGVFDLFSTKIFLTGSTSGKGVVVENKSKKETFMKMYKMGAGLGVGVKSFVWIYVFQTKEALDTFTNKGWEFGADADASAKWGARGGATGGGIQVAPGIIVYQLVDKGLALDAMVGGTKYWKNDKLNAGT